MLRKILSLCLVAVMLSTVAFATEFVDLTSVHAAEEAAEPFEKTVTANTTDNPIELLKVTQSETDGVVSQKITTVDWTADAKTIAANSWFLAKINVGRNLNFETMTFQVRTQMICDETALPQTSTAYCIPLAYTDFNSAKAIEANSSASLSTLVKPSENIEGVVSKSKTIETSGNSTQNIKLTLNADVFNGESDYYHDGYVYVAFTITGITKPGTAESGTNTNKLAVKGKSTAYWQLYATGTIAFSDSVIGYNKETGTYTVTTTATSGKAMLIAASFNGTTMVDAKVATIDAATAENGVISGTISDLAAGDSVKIFLWAENTLVPAIGVSDF